MILKKIDKSGVASIPLVMGLLILIISVGLFISSISLSDSLSSSNQEKSNLALSYAQLGVREALVRITRFPCYDCSNNFQIEMVANGCMPGLPGCVTVEYTPATVPTSSEVIITSQGDINDVIKRVQVNVNLDAYGKIISYTWQ